MSPADRELLTLAAQAAGIVYTTDRAVQRMNNEVGFMTDDGGIYWMTKDGGRFRRWWNPLEADGDAFRLQVAVGMIVNAPTPLADHAEARYYDIIVQEPCESLDEAGRRAATRRAIVRCAAENEKRRPS